MNPSCRSTGPGPADKRMKGALTLFAQDAASKLMLYTAADIHAGGSQRAGSRCPVLLAEGSARGVASTFVFDSKFTTYEQLSLLNSQGIRFITLRRRGKNTGQGTWRSSSPGRRSTSPTTNGNTPILSSINPLSTLTDYEGQLRQIILRGNGREEPAFLITNDF